MAAALREDLSGLTGWSDVRLWLFGLYEEPPPERLAWLAPDEQRRAARFAFAHDRRRYLAAHVQLRELLAQATGLAPALQDLVSSPHGKPALAASACEFNLSHCADTGAIVLGSIPLGVDVEVLRRVEDRSALAQRCFTPTEQLELAQGAEDQTARDTLFLHGWTRKEACLKAVGSGLSLEPDTFEAGLAPHPRDVRIEWEGAKHLLTVHSFRHGDTIGAVARLLPHD